MDFPGSDGLHHWGTAGQQLSTQRQASDAKAISEKPVVTDAYETFGKHVQKEAA
jgi:hypothetical protein